MLRQLLGNSRLMVDGYQHDSAQHVSMLLQSERVLQSFEAEIKSSISNRGYHFSCVFLRRSHSILLFFNTSNAALLITVACLPTLIGKPRS